MRILKSHPLLRMVNSYLIDSPQPSNLSYSWNYGSLLAFCLVIQIVTGITLAMHYNPSVLEAFNSVEHIMRDVNNGWLIRYLHSNTASAFFFLVYLHIGRGMYYGSYRAPRTLVWAIGTILLVVMMATAFLGYVLPYGQMSLWGATVITNLMSAIPWIGQDIVEFIWGGFSVNNATLNRFFSLHFVLPFVLAALALMHLIALHDVAGSGNPLGLSGNYDRIPFAPYYIFKDLITIFLLIIILSLFVFFMPNVLGDSENYIMANPMQTPPAIVPEWYLLPFYAILRSIPNKLLGVIAMFSAILILLMLPITDLSKFRGIQFKPLSKIAFWLFVANFLILMQLGAKHVESPFIEFGQISTILYFSYFLIILPLVTLFENTLMELYFGNKTREITTKNINIAMASITANNLFFIIITAFILTAFFNRELIMLDVNIFYLFIILLFLGFILYTLFKYKYLNHRTLIELICTIISALFLILIAYTSFNLLYLIEELDLSLAEAIKERDPIHYLYLDNKDFIVSYKNSDNLESYSSNNEDNSNLDSSNLNEESSSSSSNQNDNSSNNDNTNSNNEQSSTSNNNFQPNENSSGLDTSLPLDQFNSLNPWDSSKIAGCEHRDRNPHGLAQDEGDAPIPCDICSHNATSQPGDNATFCNGCGAIICHNCDFEVSGVGASPINTDSDLGDD